MAVLKMYVTFLLSATATAVANIIGMAVVLAIAGTVAALLLISPTFTAALVAALAIVAKWAAWAGNEVILPKL